MNVDDYVSGCAGAGLFFGFSFKQRDNNVCGVGWIANRGLLFNIQKCSRLLNQFNF
jgi:hypothetical protein